MIGRGVYNAVDAKIRDRLKEAADAARYRRETNVLDSLEAQGKTNITNEEVAQAAQVGLLEGALRDLASDSAGGQVARGAIVGSGLTASGAGLVQLMQFLSQGTQAQAERNDVLPS